MKLFYLTVVSEAPPPETLAVYRITSFCTKHLVWSQRELCESALCSWCSQNNGPMLVTQGRRYVAWANGVNILADVSICSLTCS